MGAAPRRAELALLDTVSDGVDVVGRVRAADAVGGQKVLGLQSAGVY